MYLHWLMYWMDLRRSLKIQDQSMTALCSMMVTCGGDFLSNIYFCASDKQNVCDKKCKELKKLYEIVGKRKIIIWAGHSVLPPLFTRFKENNETSIFSHFFKLCHWLWKYSGGLQLRDIEFFTLEQYYDYIIVDVLFIVLLKFWKNLCTWDRA